MSVLLVCRLDPDVPLPVPQHPGDAGLDLCSAVDAEIAPGERRTISTGLAVAVPPGHAGLLLPRSGKALRDGLTLPNAPALIDSGYRGELLIPVVNLDRVSPVTILRGERIAQLVVIAVPAVDVAEVSDLPPGDRGDRGFGSTGRT